MKTEKLKWHTEKRKVDDLVPYEGNPRQMTEKQVDDLRKSLERFDLVEIPAVDTDNKIIAGHQRLKIMQILGRGNEEIDVRLPNRKLTQKEFEEYNLRSNRNTGEWDYDLLANFKKEELLNVGFTNKELDKIFDLELIEEEIKKSKKLSEIKILNLYSGMGGNRRLWGDLDITAVESNEKTAKIYSDYFPKDKLIIDDAHKYLEKHFEEYDFIWASPPCPTHSRLRKWGKNKAIYPDMKLYEEIVLLQGYHLRLYEEVLFLQGYHKGKFCIENVISWYKPLIEPLKRGRHYYWTNFDIPEDGFPEDIEIGSLEDFDSKKNAKRFGYNIDGYTFKSSYPKDKVVRDMVHPKVGKFILESAYKDE